MRRNTVMNIDSARLIYFSPTHTTRIIVEAIAQGFQSEHIIPYDLTLPQSKTRMFDKLGSELAIIGVPVYSGRVPEDAIDRLRRIRANDTPAVIVVLYGNRDYNDALLELKDLSVETGFKPVAGGAFVGEHSWATEETPIAAGRPDTEDLQKAEAFGRLIRDKLIEFKTTDDILPLNVPGKYPHRKRMQPRNTSPVTSESLCTLCHTCEEVCPTAAIAVDDAVETDPGLCILCCACVKNCPTQARAMEEPRVKQIAKRVWESCSGRKEPVIYI
jgi:ferredoxin